jgi:hypothetical protein
MKMQWGLSILMGIVFAGCSGPEKKQTEAADSAAAQQPAAPVNTGSGQELTLPPPLATKSLRNFSHVIGWPAGKTPAAPAGTATLWAAVNERDELGDDLVPDYFTSVRDGGFYGWPYSYYGQHIDPRIPADQQKPELVKKAIAPDIPLGAHTASIGLAFYTGKSFPVK